MDTHVIRLRGPWSLELQPGSPSSSSLKQETEIESAVALESARTAGAAASDRTGTSATRAEPSGSGAETRRQSSPRPGQSLSVPIDLGNVVPPSFSGRVVLQRKFNCPTGLDEATRIELQFENLPLTDRLREIRLGDEIVWTAAKGNIDASEPRRRRIALDLGPHLSLHNRLTVIWEWPEGLSGDACQSGQSVEMRDRVATGAAESLAQFQGAKLVIVSGF